MYLHNYGPTLPELEGAWGAPAAEFDEALMCRLRSALVAALETSEITPPDLWSLITPAHQGCVMMLLDGSYRAANEILGNLFATPLAQGYQQGEALACALAESVELRRGILAYHLDRLLSLGDALGVLQVQNPEQGDNTPYLHVVPDAILDRIERKIGCEIRAPAFQGGLWALKTHRGLFSEREFMALYTALRIRVLTDSSDPHVCEIGGGAGYVAYYARLLGMRNYTIIDLPSVGMAQGYFLALNIGANNVTVLGEPVRSDAVNIRPPAYFHQPGHHWDIVINADSMPEISREVTDRYLDAIARSSRLFLSINHEAAMPRTTGNDLHEPVSSSVERCGRFSRLYRMPFWQRRGYVEELFCPKGLVVRRHLDPSRR